MNYVFVSGRRSRSPWQCAAAGITLVLLLLTLAASARADVTARIRGTVTDPQSAVVPNVTVTATNQNTGVAFTTVSQPNGSYQFLQLPVGTYSITASPQGYRKFTATNIVLTIDQQYVQDIHLQLGQATETVEVTANQVQVDTTNIQLNNVVNSQQLTELPLIGRNFTQLEQLFPGVQASSDRFGTYSANGAQTQQSSFLINGTDINDAPLNTAVVIPSLDAVQQFNLVTSSLNPEYSRNSGAIVSVNVKNGENQFHGDVFEFYRDTFLNTPNYFQTIQHGGKGAPIYHQNLFGGTIGGPIWKDKAFFFFSYQGNRNVSPQAGGTGIVVFTPDELNNGNFTLNSSGLPLPAGQTHQTFSSNVIPASISVPGCAAGATWANCAAALTNAQGQVIFPTSAFNPLAMKLVHDFVPLPTVGNSYSFNPKSVGKQNQYIIRGDFTPSQSNQFWWVGIFEKRPTVVDLPFTGASLPGFGETDGRSTKNMTFDFTHTFSTTMLNDFRVGWTRFNYSAVFPTKNIDPKAYGFNITPQMPQYNQMPVISVSGMFTLGFSTNGPQPRLDQNYQVNDTISKMVGNHMLKFGFDGRRFEVNNPFYANLMGSYTFSSAAKYSTGDAGLDFLLGIPSGYSQGSGAQINARAYETYAFFQDQWKARSNLTLTYGAGWQVDEPWANMQYQGKGVICWVQGQQSKVFPTAPLGINYPGDSGCTNKQGAKNTWKDFGPRLGFAYAPNLGFLSGGDAHKLSIRGGFGIYFNRTEEEGALQNLMDPPYGISSNGIRDVSGGRPTFADPWRDINNGLTTAGNVVSIPNKFPASQYAPGATDVPWDLYEPMYLSQYSPNYTMPYAENFNLTIERELPGQVVASVSYVGSMAHKLQVTVEGNPITQAGHAACLASYGSADPTCFVDRAAQATEFPDHVLNGMGDIVPSIGMISSLGNSNYHSLQLSARKGMTHGLMFQASYTWSHAMDTGSSLENSGWGGFRGFNTIVPSLNYGDSNFDARHRFVFSPVYTIPNWKNIPGIHWLPDAIGKGWQLSGVLTLATGFPVDIYTGGYNSLWCSGDQYYSCADVPNQAGPVLRVDPRLAGGGSINPTHPTYVYWFNPNNLVAAEPIGSFGNFHKTPIHGPGINNADVTLAKNIYIVPSRENIYMQLRLESYNVFNHTQFSNPSTGGVSSSASTGALTMTSAFGRITSAAAGRQTQIALKVYF